MYSITQQPFIPTCFASSGQEFRYYFHFSYYITLVGQWSLRWDVKLRVDGYHWQSVILVSHERPCSLLIIHLSAKEYCYQAWNVVYLMKTIDRDKRTNTDSEQRQEWWEKPWPSSRILISAGNSTSRRLISSTVGFIGITDADKVIVQGEIKQRKIECEKWYGQHLLVNERLFSCLPR